MKIILISDVPNLGKSGTATEVSDGYGRNYLIPRKMAISATPEALKSLEEQKKVEQRKAEKERKKMEELKTRLEGAEITIKTDVGESGRLFGSITSTDIAETLKTSLGIEIDKRKIELEEPLKILGEYQISIKLLADLEATLKLKIEPAS